MRHSRSPVPLLLTLAGIGTIMLAEDIALSQVGDVTEAVVGGVAAIGAFGVLVLVVGLNGRLHRHRRRIGVAA